MNADEAEAECSRSSRSKNPVGRAMKDSAFHQVIGGRLVGLKYAGQLSDFSLDR